jgi:hypothetical protein
MPRLELKSSRTILAIKRCERTKLGKVIQRSQSLIYMMVHICATSGNAVNSVTAMDPHERPLFNELLWWLVTLRYFLSVVRKLALIFGFNRSVPPFYSACCFDELSRGSVSCLFNTSFEKRFHNATTWFFTPKSMTMASAEAMRGE